MLIMKSLKKSPAEIKEDKAELKPSADYPVDMYPYGLCISLTEEELKVLDVEAPTVGSTIQFMAQAKVTSASERETDKGKTCRVELQITDMGFETPEPARELTRYGSK